MAVSSTDNKVTYTGNDVATDFPYAFKIFADTELTVEKITISTEAIETLTLTTDYTVTGAGEDSGGNVVLPEALSSLYKLTIRRVLPMTQLTDYVENDSAPAETFEENYDRAIMITQQIQEQVDRCIKIKPYVTGMTTLLPEAQANYYLGWNSTGTALENKISIELGDADLDTDGTLTANSDTRVASQKATKTYVDTSIQVNTETAKTTPVNADIVLIEDSAATWARKKLSWTNIKATLKSYFDTLYASWSLVGNLLYPTETDNNLCIGGDTDAGTSGKGVLVIKKNTAPTSSPADCVQLYAEDISAADQVPAMTADDAPSPYVISTDITPINDAYYCFDDVTVVRTAGNCFKDDTYQGSNHYVRVDFGSGNTKVITGFTLTTNSSYPTHCASAWKIQGSNNASDWDDLDTQTSQSWSASEKKSFSFSNSTGYRYYQFYWTAIENGDEISIHQMEFIAAGAELKVRDEIGNTTTLSPHNFKNIPTDRLYENKKNSDDLAWTYHSSKNGKEITVDMFRSIQLLEKLTGEKLIYTNEKVTIENKEKPILLERLTILENTEVK
jgi:hypothetical protein